MSPLDRRSALKFLAVAGTTAASSNLLDLFGSGSSDLTSGSDDTTTTTPDDGSGCGAADDTTAGPYPDKVGMMADEKYYRRDITEGLYPAAVPLAMTVIVTDASTECSPLEGYTVEIWHCDPSGHYSEYAGQPGGYNGTGTTYLRGFQITDAQGAVTFDTVYPGWYSGRTTHIHFKVHKDGNTVKKTTQAAFDETTNGLVNHSAGYPGTNPTTNATDQVFAKEGDGVADNLATVMGDLASGFTASWRIGV
ncbi:dioxygenase family protein [Rhodococcus sp. NPDC003322]